MSGAKWISVIAAQDAAKIGQAIEVRGWVRTRRDSKGGFSFIEVNDGSCLSNLQIIAEAALPNYATEIANLSVGASIVASGELKASQGSGQATELLASSVRVIGEADPQTYPLQKNDTRLKSCASGLTCVRAPIRLVPWPACATS